MPMMFFDNDLLVKISCVAADISYENESIPSVFITMVCSTDVRMSFRSACDHHYHWLHRGGTGLISFLVGL